MEGAHQGQYAQSGYDGRGEGRERAEEYQQHQHQHPHHQQSHPSQQHQQQLQQQQQQQALPPHPQQTPQQQQVSPPPSASPFAFAPPPLSAHPHQGQGQGSSRPALPLHHSEPPPQQAQYHQYGPKPPPQPQHHHSFPGYPGGGQPLAYRSFSGESSRQSPIQAHLPRPPMPGQGPSPSMAPLPSPATTSPYAYQRQPSYAGPPNGLPSPHEHHQQSPQRSNMYPPNYYASPYTQAPPQGPPAPPPGAADMPRSLSYTAGAHHSHPYQPAYHPYVPMSGAVSMGGHHPGGPPPLNRNHTTSALSNGIANMELVRHAPSLGYSFANRLPLVDRPFKCDECVQSFNRNHDLKRHKRIHLSVKPFGCDKCGKTFSRKDALRRHWLVKGCRGEEGATAPIIPLFPINSAVGMSPPSPQSNHSPIDNVPPHQFPTAHMGFNHPSAPPPLTSLPSRQPSGQSLVIVTPTDPNQNGDGAVLPPLEEPLGVNPGNANMAPGAPRASSSSGEGGDGYFEGVVGLKSDGTAVLDHTPPEGSPYSRIDTNHQGQFHQPYRRQSNMAPHPSGSPTIATHHSTARPYTPSTLGPDGKPVFAMPFARGEYPQAHQEGMLAPPFDNGAKMEKQLSQMSQASVEAETFTHAPRWHRPSFPFPPTAGNVYSQPNYEQTSPVDAAAPQHPILAHGYSQ